MAHISHFMLGHNATLFPVSILVHEFTSKSFFNFVINRWEWKRLKGRVFSPPSVRPVPARGREARKWNPSIASIPTPVYQRPSEGSKRLHSKTWFVYQHQCWDVLCPRPSLFMSANMKRRGCELMSDSGRQKRVASGKEASRRRDKDSLRLCTAACSQENNFSDWLAGYLWNWQLWFISCSAIQIPLYRQGAKLKFPEQARDGKQSGP